MGNSASSLPYSIDGQVGSPQDHNGWALHEGKSTGVTSSKAAVGAPSAFSNFAKEGAKVSVFVGKKPALAKTPVSPRHTTKMQLLPAYHHYQNCRKLRHPHILQVLATLDTDNPTAAATEGAISSNTADSTAQVNNTKATGDLIVVTEPCMSLDTWLLSSPTPEQLAWGLESIIRGLHFLHNDAKLVHGNLNPSSFYVTLAGDVKLWNFSLITSIDATIGPSRHFQEWESSITPDAYRSQERLDSNWNAIAIASNNGSAVHGMDSYGLGILMDHYWNGHIPLPLQKATQRLLTANLKMRPRLQPLLKCPVFQTAYQKIQLQLAEITVQPVEQKVALWQTLLTQLQNTNVGGSGGGSGGGLSKSVAVYKVLPLVQNSILSICSNPAMISQDLYRREVLAMVGPLFFISETYLQPEEIGPSMENLVGLLFVVKDRAVRGALLNKIDLLASHLDVSVLNSAVFEPLCSGFSDSSPTLREMTLKSTLVLVPKLNAPNLEKLSRYLIRLQSDSETTIRTNTVIFIGKLASYLPESSQQKLLLPAYVRSMKDSFTPCRLAALQSTLKTKDHFQMADIATKVLPAVMPLLLDPMPNVRAEAFTVVDTLLAMLRQESQRMATIAQQQAAAEAAAQGHGGGPNMQQQQNQQQQLPPNMSGRYNSGVGAAQPSKTTVAPAPSSGSYLSGLSSWMSSSTQPTESAPPAQQQQQQQQQSRVASAPSTAPLPPANLGGVPRQQQQLPTQQFSALSMTTSSSLAAPPIADDGWGDEDVGVADDDSGGWGDEDDDIDADLGGSGGKSGVTPNNGMMTMNDPFSADLDDPFASIGAMPAKKATIMTAAPRSGSGMKLVVPKKKTLLSTPKPVAAAPATKLKLDDSVNDGWDDF